MSAFSYIDTHCHLDSILKRLKLPRYRSLKEDHFPEDFEACITISCDPHAIQATRDLMEEEGVYGAFGIHPHDAKEYTPQLEAELEACMALPKCVAWGEIGLDYYYNKSDPAKQQEVFARQLHKGMEHQKPLIVHTREAEEDTLRLLKDQVPPHWKIHVHCFTSSASMASALLQHFENLYIGFTGIVTFGNAEEVRDTVREVPLNRILLETDGPYLSPAPFRGKTAHPGYIPYIAEKIAEVKAVSVEDVYRQARENTRAVYGI